MGSTTIHCPHCHRPTETDVVDSRPAASGEQIRRRRECKECGKRYTTREAIFDETDSRSDYEDRPRGVHPVETMSEANAFERGEIPKTKSSRTPKSVFQIMGVWTMSDWEKAHNKRPGRGKLCLLYGCRPEGMQIVFGEYVVPEGTPWPMGRNGKPLKFD